METLFHSSLTKILNHLMAIRNFELSTLQKNIFFCKLVAASLRKNKVKGSGNTSKKKKIGNIFKIDSFFFIICIYHRVYFTQFHQNWVGMFVFRIYSGTNVLFYALLEYSENTYLGRF